MYMEPLYTQVKKRITESLVRGEWNPGEVIPSEIELAHIYDVSQGTVRKAIDELTAAPHRLAVDEDGSLRADNGEITFGRLRVIVDFQHGLASQPRT